MPPGGPAYSIGHALPSPFLRPTAGTGTVWLDTTWATLTGATPKDRDQNSQAPPTGLRSPGTLEFSGSVLSPGARVAGTRRPLGSPEVGVAAMTGGAWGPGRPAPPPCSARVSLRTVT